MTPMSQSPSKTPRQQSIPGTEPDNPDITAAIEDWLEAVDAKKSATETAQVKDDAIVQLMLDAKLAYYPYTDPSTGKRKYRIVDTSPRGKSVANRADTPEEVDEAELSESEEAEPTKDKEAKAVEHKKRNRASVESELAERDAHVKARDEADDPFASARSAMEGSLRPARVEDHDEPTGRNGGAPT